MRATRVPSGLTGAGRRWSVEEVVRRLRECHGRPPRFERLDPLSELVATILSQNTSDANSSRAFGRLCERFPTWDQVADAPTSEVADAIRSGGLANIKAPRLQAVLRAIRARRGRLSLDYLNGLTPEAAQHELAGFDGVGPKTVACVLLFACGMPVLPVDTHVHRVSQRLGLIPPKTSAAQAHQPLQRLVPPRLIYSFHMLVIRHGRTICRARRPACDRCVLAARCPSRFPLPPPPPSGKRVVSSRGRMSDSASPRR